MFTKTLVKERREEGRCGSVTFCHVIRPFYEDIELENKASNIETNQNVAYGIATNHLHLLLLLIILVIWYSFLFYVAKPLNKLI